MTEGFTSPIDPKAAHLAVVWKAGRRAGTLVRATDHVEFGYDDGYRGPPVATTLPIGKSLVRTGSAGAVPPFFAGLLPEGRRLHALRRAIKTSADDDFSLLLAVGRDLIGDVQVLWEGDEPGLWEPDPPIQVSLENRFSELFARVIGLDAADRVGLPGVQDKVSGRMIAMPVRQDGGAFLLKLNPKEFPHLVENEALFSGIARTMGIPVAESRLIRDGSGAPGLLVSRFDRPKHGSGPPVMLAQEDACQVLGRYPADKYRVTAEEVVMGLSSQTGAPLVAARDLLRQIAFAYLSGNGDAHAKNFSILDRGNGEWSISPAYDLPSSYPYGDTTMALSIAGRIREDIGREHFLALGEAAGLRPPAVIRVLDGLVRATPTWLDRLEDLPFPARTRHKLRRAVEYRARRLAGPG